MLCVQYGREERTFRWLLRNLGSSASLPSVRLKTVGDIGEVT